MKKIIYGLMLVGVFMLLSNSLFAQASLMNGRWIPVQQEMAGKQLSAASFATQELHISDTLYTVLAESMDRGVIKLSGSRMDIYAREGVNAGKHFKAIYRMDRDQLMVCYDLSGKEYPSDFSTNNKPQFFMAVYKKTQIAQ